MKKLFRYTYENDESGDCGRELLRDETGKVLLEGDYYHDHISNKIDGFIKTVKLFEPEVEIKIVESNCKEYGLC